MTDLKTAVSFSCFLHAAVFLTLMHNPHGVKGPADLKNQPVVIDFTMDPSPAGFTGGSGGSNVSAPQTRASAGKRPAPVVIPKTPAPEQKTDPAEVDDSDDPASDSVTDHPAPDTGKTTALSAASESAGHAGPAGVAGSGNGLQEGNGHADKGTGTSAGDLYLREHFTYIRELIRKKLRYPRPALAQGLSGRVGVSFTVLLNGHVTDLTVARSSGVGMLDRDAVETVKLAAPFPPPPVSARLVIPVDYILK